MDRRITNVPNSPFAVRQLVCALLPRQQFPPKETRKNVERNDGRRLASSVCEADATTRPIFVHGVRAEHVAISNLLAGGVEWHTFATPFSLTRTVLLPTTPT